MVTLPGAPTPSSYLRSAVTTNTGTHRTRVVQEVRQRLLLDRSRVSVGRNHGEPNPQVGGHDQHSFPSRYLPFHLHRIARRVFVTYSPVSMGALNRKVQLTSGMRMNGSTRTTISPHSRVASVNWLVAVELQQVESRVSRFHHQVRCCHIREVLTTAVAEWVHGNLVALTTPIVCSTNINISTVVGARGTHQRLVTHLRLGA